MRVTLQGTDDMTDDTTTDPTNPLQADVDAARATLQGVADECSLHRSIVDREIADAISAVKARYAEAAATLSGRFVTARDELDRARLAVGRASPLLGRRVRRPEIPGIGVYQIPLPACTGTIACQEKRTQDSVRCRRHVGQLIVMVDVDKGSDPRLAEVLAMKGERLPRHWTLVD